MSGLIAHWGAWLTLILLQLALWTGILVGIVALHRSHGNQQDSQSPNRAQDLSNPPHDAANSASKLCKSR
jgi:hypothetical protein